ncbi:glycosyltransferase family 9 protein [Arenibaculum pallidiluteum]|uniref:glycosyltransferase family 9 protein n=1 Tax=Arenibaculum pallidiluteum TaxID=2812559 RepID=UPI001A9748D8|nr:glycosyltransferase family 9 protein [Arenibaculum pallidiluteum]
MKVLFIGWNRLGDAVMSTALLRHILDEHPDARITLLSGPVAWPILQPTPNLERGIVVVKQPMKRHWLSLLREFAGTRWDLVVDLRDTLLSRIVRAPRKMIKHRARVPGPILRELGEIAGTDLPWPQVWLDPAEERRAAELLDGKHPIVTVGLGASKPIKFWPVDRYVELASRLRPLLGGDPWFMTVGSAAEAEMSRAFLASVPENRRIDLPAIAPRIEFQAACIARADFYVGNDSGHMHVAASLGVPTLGIFGPTDSQVYGPFGPRVASVGVGAPGETGVIERVGVDTVFEAARALLARGGRP